MRHVIIVEDNRKLRQALIAGLEATGKTKVVFDCGSGEEALHYFTATADEAGSEEKSPLDPQDPVDTPEAILMDVQLAGPMNGIQAAGDTAHP